MPSENKYSLTITAKSGDRVLTRIVYPEQNYAELVTAQIAVAGGLFKAGLDQAIVKGDEVPPEIAAMYGVSVGKNSGTIR